MVKLWELSTETTRETFTGHQKGAIARARSLGREVFIAQECQGCHAHPCGKFAGAMFRVDSNGRAFRIVRVAPGLGNLYVPLRAAA